MRRATKRSIRPRVMMSRKGGNCVDEGSDQEDDDGVDTPESDDELEGR